MGRRIFVLGGGHSAFIGKGHKDFIWKRHPDYGVRNNPNLKELIKSSLVEACKAANISDLSVVDRAFMSNFLGELFVSQGHLGAALVGVDSALEGVPSMRIEGACASGGLAVSCGIDAIKGGADVVLVSGAEVQTTVSARVGGDYLARASDYERQRGIDDFTFPALFAQRTKAYREKYGVEESVIGRAAVKAYSNANRNPLAHMNGRKMTLENASEPNERNPTFLSNEEFSPFMKMSDCSQVSDGASSLFLVSEAGLEKLGASLSDAIEVVGWGQATSSLYSDSELTSLPTTALAAKRAYESAGISAEDVEVAEVHDCFTLTEILMMEALGFADAGKGGDMLVRGETEIEGSLPVNTGGGLVGFGHPVGATGVKQVIEIWRQMKGRCGDYQMPKLPSVGITANMGGDDKTAVVGLYRNL